MMCGSKGAVLLTLKLCDDEELMTLSTSIHCGYSEVSWEGQ